MIAEREVTKLMELVMDIHSQLGIKKPVDDELENMQKPTNIQHLTEAAQTAEDENSATSSAKVTLDR
jgi:acyl carrier protein